MLRVVAYIDLNGALERDPSGELNLATILVLLTERPIPAPRPSHTEDSAFAWDLESEPHRRGVRQRALRALISLLVLFGRILIRGNRHARLAVGDQIQVSNGQPRFGGIRPFVTTGRNRQRRVDSDRRESTDHVRRTRSPLDLLLGAVPRTKKLLFDERHEVGPHCGGCADGHAKSVSCPLDELRPGTSWPSARARSWFNPSKRPRISARESGETVQRCN